MTIGRVMIDRGTIGRTLSLAVAALLVLARPVAGQESVGDLLSFLLTNQSVVTGDFLKDEAAAAATRDTLSGLLVIELATLPVGSSSSGFTYRLNPRIATLERSSENFGPFLLERALTAGRGQTSFGVNYRHARFATLDNRALRDGSLITVANRFEDEADAFDVELLTLELAASTVTFFGTYGATDRLDIGIALPIVSLRMEGERINRYRGARFQQARASAFVTGLADVVTRVKYGLVQRSELSLAAEVDTRLPTGDDRNLLGAGRAGMSASAVASVERRQLGAHLRGGAGWGGVSDELFVGGATVFALTPRLSVVGEAHWRRLEALSHVEEMTLAHPVSAGVQTTRLVPGAGGTSTWFGVAGMKWNIANTWLVQANVLVPVTRAGLVARVTPSFSLDYTFGR